MFDVVRELLNGRRPVGAPRLSLGIEPGEGLATAQAEALLEALLTLGALYRQLLHELVQRGADLLSHRALHRNLLRELSERR